MTASCGQCQPTREPCFTIPENLDVSFKSHQVFTPASRLLAARCTDEHMPPPHYGANGLVPRCCMDDTKAKAAAFRERAQGALWIADMVTRDDARRILFQIAAEYEGRARQLEEIINTEGATKAAANSTG